MAEIIENHRYCYPTRAVNAIKAWHGSDWFYENCGSQMLWPITENDLFRVPNMGKKSIEEIKRELARNGGRLLNSGEPHPKGSLENAAKEAAERALTTLKYCGHASVKDTEIVLQYAIKGAEVTEVPPEHQPHAVGAIRVTIEFL